MDLVFDFVLWRDGGRYVFMKYISTYVNACMRMYLDFLRIFHLVRICIQTCTHVHTRRRTHPYIKRDNTALFAKMQTTPTTLKSNTKANKTTQKIMQTPHKKHANNTKTHKHIYAHKRTHKSKTQKQHQ